MIPMRGCGSAPRWHWERRATRAVTALASIARRDSTDRWTRTAVLSSCSQMADWLFVQLSSGPVAIGSDDKASSMRELLDSLAAIVRARNRPDEVGRFLDALAARYGKKIDGSLLDEMQTMVLALARGARRSGGRVDVDVDSPRPGAVMVARLIQRATMRAKDEQTPETEVRDAIDVLSTIDPDRARPVLLERLAAQQPLNVQVAVVQAMAEDRSANVPDILLPRLRGFEPAVRAAAIRTLLSRVDWTKALLLSIKQGAAAGINAALDRAG